jgi:hypothetical protein
VKCTKVEIGASFVGRRRSGAHDIGVGVCGSANALGEKGDGVILASLGGGLLPLLAGRPHLPQPTNTHHKLIHKKAS